jgi:polygalacturonase
VKDNQTVYIEGGAVVHGVIVAKNVKNVTIKGRGILDASSFPRDQGNIIQMTDCENIAIEGIILRDAPSFAVVAFGSSNIRVDNIKLVGMWRYNADGIDVINSHDVTINNSFMRTFDDAIALKGVKGWHVEPGGWGMEWDRAQQGNIYNVFVNNCVVWCDWGRALEIGAETVADSIYHCFFRNSDIIRYVNIAMDIQSGDRAEIFDIHYENIRVEEPILDDQYLENPENLVTDITKIASFGAKRIGTSENLGRLFEILLNKSIYSKDSILGKVHDISYENITYTSGHVQKSFFTGYSDTHDVSNIVFKNVWMNGKKAIGAADANIIITNDFVKGVRFE